MEIVRIYTASSDKNSRFFCIRSMSWRLMGGSLEDDRRWRETMRRNDGIPHNQDRPGIGSADG